MKFVGNLVGKMQFSPILEPTEDRIKPSQRGLA